MVFELAKTNDKFAEGLGYSLGRIYNILDKEMQQKVSTTAEGNRIFLESFMKSYPSAALPTTPVNIKHVTARKSPNLVKKIFLICTTYSIE
jgi:hypothetical protein